MKRKSVRIILILIASIALLSTAGIACTAEIGAQPDEETDSGYPLLVERFAERFDLDPDEIMEFLKELKEERIASTEEKFEEKLDELVEDGKITEEQKKAILEKKEELAAFKEELEGMTIAEACEAIKDMREELKDWAEENDLQLKNFFPKKGAHPFGFRDFKNHRPLFRR
ncbi:MAG: hypothetical protein KAI62_01645 [Actinomycetia bacterium]|nr:hypothetical protein [Actinomycetes bacterium]